MSILSEPGKGYRMVDGYRLPQCSSLQRTAALITADKLIELHTDKSLDQDYKSALFKIKSILRQTDKEYLQALEDNIQVLPNPYLPVKKDQQHQAGYIQSIIEAIAHKKIIQLSYKTRDQDQSSIAK
jgi:predicted DNA-binding transcriptional regulator YafY